MPSNELRARIEWALSMANLKGQENLITGTLPGGWKQRLALGCAVLHRPPVIFLDEPTSGVDPITRRQFWDLIHQMAEAGVTVFVTTHYMEEAEYCNRLALIFRGKIVALGTPSELKRDSMKGEILLVECDPLGAAVEALQSAPGVMDAAVFGNALLETQRQGVVLQGSSRTWQRSLPKTISRPSLCAASTKARVWYPVVEHRINSRLPSGGFRNIWGSPRFVSDVVTAQTDA